MRTRPEPGGRREVGHRAGADSRRSCPRCTGVIHRTATVNTVEFDAIRLGDLPVLTEEFVRCGESHVVHFCPADPTTIARRHPVYREMLNRGALNLPDGMAVVWTLRLLGHTAERVYGPDAFRLLADTGRVAGLRHYLYGGTPRVVRDLRRSLELACPGIQIVGAESPPFRPISGEEVEAAAGRMRAAGAALVWVGLGTPKQDVMAERLRAARAAPVLLCVGAAFDYLSGRKSQAPAWMQRSGLEWTYRLVQEPRRLWRRYLIGNPRFVAGVVADAAGWSDR